MKSQRHEADRLSSIVRPWRNRLALKGALEWATLGLAGGLGIAIILLAVARLVPWPAVLLWCILAIVAGIICGLVYSFATRPTLQATARQTDHLMGLSDRLGTAWELRSSFSTFATVQRRDALASAGALVPGESIMIWPSLRHFLPVMVGLVLFGLLLAVPNPMDHVIQEREHLREQLVQVGEELRRTEKELTEPEASLSAEDRAAAEEILKKLQEALRDSRDIPSALAALSEAEQEIGLLQEPKISQSRGLREFGVTLASSPATRAMGQALQSGDGPALYDSINVLADQLASMSEAELQELAATFQRAANAATGQGALSGSLRKASRAIASGDPRTAGSDLSDLADRLVSLQEEIEASQVLANTLSDLQDARSFISGVSLAQAGGGMGVEREGREGRGSVSGSGQGGEGGNVGGAGRGGQGIGGATGIGSGGGMGGSGAGNQPGARSGEGTERPLTDGETLFVPGQGPDIPTEVRAGPGIGIAPGRLLPYEQIWGEYAEQAREHMERSPVPDGYKDLVRRYFSELER